MNKEHKGRVKYSSFFIPFFISERNLTDYKCRNDCPLRVSVRGGLAHLGNFCLQNSPNGQQRHDKSQQGGVNGKASHSVIFYQLHKEIYGYKSR